MRAMWHREHGRSTASPHALAILDDLERQMVGLDDPRPLVSSIRTGAGLQDLHDFEVELELAPGVTLATRYQSVDEDNRDPDALEDEAGAVAWQAAETAKELHAYGIGKLADLLHGMRIRTRQVMAEWCAAGIGVSLIDIRLVRTEHWRHEEALTVEVRVRSLDGRLRPAVETLEVTRPEILDERLAAWRTSLAVRFAAQADLARQGAEGMVDRLALNAIAQRWDVAEAVRGISRGRPYGITEQLTVFVQNGYVRCHGRNATGTLSWNRDAVEIHGCSIPVTVATALRGRPVTHLVEHAVLTDDMIITDVTPSHDRGKHSIRARFDQPRLLFCGASGRVWAP